MSSFTEFVDLVRRNSAQKGKVSVQRTVFKPAARRAAKVLERVDEDEDESSFGSKPTKGSKGSGERQVVDFASAKREVMRLGEAGFTIESREMAEEKRAILLGAKPRKHVAENYADFLKNRAEDQVKRRRTERLKSAVKNWERDEHVRVKRQRKEDVQANGRMRGALPSHADKRSEHRKPLKRGRVSKPRFAGKAKAAAIKKRGGIRAFDGVPGKYMDGVQRISRKLLDSMRPKKPAK